MIFAQIKDNLIQNTIVLSDESVVNLFQNDPITQLPYDFVLRVDMIYPQPGIGWTFDGIIFQPPEQPEDSEE